MFRDDYRRFTAHCRRILTALLVTCAVAAAQRPDTTEAGIDAARGNRDTVAARLHDIARHITLAENAGIRAARGEEASLGEMREHLGTAREFLDALARSRYGRERSDARRAEARWSEVVERLYTALEPKLVAALAGKSLAPDPYRGADAGYLERAIRRAWGVRWPGDVVVAIQMEAESWRRNVREHYDEASRSWHRADVSRLPVRVWMATATELAVGHAVVVTRDNDTGRVALEALKFAGGDAREALRSQLVRRVVGRGGAGETDQQDATGPAVNGGAG